MFVSVGSPRRCLETYPDFRTRVLRAPAKPLFLCLFMFHPIDYLRASCPAPC